jgi:hypothetical protein
MRSVTRAIAAALLLALSIGVATAEVDTCSDQVKKAQDAGHELSAYAARRDATTSGARERVQQARRAIDEAKQACKGKQQEAAVMFSAHNIEAIEKALAAAKTERLHDLGVFPPPDEP